MSRVDWLASLRPYTPVRLITPCGAHEAMIEELKDGRLWLMWALGYGGQFGHSSTWVNPRTRARIKPGCIGLNPLSRKL